MRASEDPTQLPMRIAAALSRSEGTPAQHIETHLSHVLLTRDRAYKLKKPVRMPFVDFTTMEQRREACVAELEVNRNLGSPIYQAVAPVIEDVSGNISVGGAGQPIDWVVVMRCFDPSHQFDELAKAGRLDRNLAKRTAERIAAMHAAAPPVLTAGHAADYRAIIRNLRRTEKEGAAQLELEIGEPSPFAALDAELARVDPLIERRRAHGKVRRVHGDLHLRNICLLDGEPTPFDALEFDERLATTDVLYDLAFLLMDLNRAGLGQQANTVMNRYWDVAGEDEDALALLPFFMSLRAAVRMAVAIEGGNLTEGETYRRLAFSLLRRSRPVLVAIGGLSGTGKSTIAAEIAPQLPGPAGARLLRSDVLRKAAVGVRPEDVRAGAGAYTIETRAHVYSELEARTASAVQAGSSVVADATFSFKSTREAILAISRIHARTFWLEAPLDVRLARVSGRRHDASDAGVDVALAQSEPTDIDTRWRRIDAARGVDEIVKDIMSEIGNVGNAPGTARHAAGEG